DSAAALRAVIDHQPDVCLLATWLPGKPLEAARLIRQTIPETKIVLLTPKAHSDELFGALRAGADGYLLMTTSPERLPDAIRGVVNGEAAIPRHLTAELVAAFRARQDGRHLTVGPERRSIALTPREFDVVDGLRKHVATAEIARGLGISEVTVRRYISSLMHKLEVSDRAALIKMLTREDPEVPIP
ncbi:MAG TPA: response regulator transcription factor, partial [Solirubrobacteraceae bacterium]|nr:response regulator transcription factor [Solirubrobacteraceae bacterium]